MIIVFPEIVVKREYFNLGFRFSLTGTLLYMLISFLFIWIYRTTKFKKSKNVDFIIKGYIIYLFCYSINRVMPIFYRITPYFIIFYILQFILILENINSFFIKKFLKYSIIILFIYNYNLNFIYNLYLSDGRYIPFHFYFEKLYKDIPYKKTAEYNHLINLFKTDDLNSIKERIIKRDISE